MTWPDETKKFLSSLTVTLAVVLGSSAAAHADPLTLSGVVTMDKLSLNIATVTAHLISSEFDVVFSTSASNWPGTFCGPCRIGTHLSVGGSFPDEPTGSGSGTIQGVTYPSFTMATGFFAIEGSTIVPPSMPGQTFTLTAPFTASGLFAPSHMIGPSALPFYTASVVGSGLATLTFVPAPEFPAGFTPHWYVTRAVYQFENVSATPEPMTLALFGGGLVLAAAQCRRRRNRG